MAKFMLLLWGVCLLTLTTGAQAMEDWEVRHLLTRTGFGVSPADYEHFKPMTFEKAVDEIIAGVRTEAKSPRPDNLDIPEPDRAAIRALPEDQRREKYNEHQRMQRQAGQDLKGWWIGEMLATDSPLTERMTLFWSNHFTSSLQKVKDPKLMYDQNALLRREAFGNFRKLTHDIAIDPAMLIYLDNQSNRKGKPNENFARELMELFTLGIGNYTEADIKESARAFTGWSYNRQQQRIVYAQRQHDEGTKTFLGKSGNFNGDSIIDIIMQQPATAQFVTAKLWKEFISPAPDKAEVERLAKVFRANNYEIKPLVKAMLLSPAFRAEANRGTLVKSPVDLLVGTARTFDAPVNEPMALVRFSKQLDQDLLDPPNVKGWPGGEAWINSNTLLQRQQMLRTVIGGPDPDRREMRGNGKGAPQKGGKGAGKNASRPAANGQAKGGRLAPMQDLPASQQVLLRRMMELRDQGLQRPAILARLQQEGHKPQEVRQAMQARQQAVALLVDNGKPAPGAAKAAPPVKPGAASSKPGESPDMMMMAEAAPPMRPGNRNGQTMPRADIDGWIRALGQDSGASSNQTIAALLLPADPAETIMTPGQPLPVRQLVLDPVYELK